MSQSVGIGSRRDERVETYLRSGAHRVQGWLDPRAARLIAALGSNQPARGAVGEIGIHHGKLFILLDLLRRPLEAAVAIDLFEEQELNAGSGRGDRQVFEANLERHSSGAAGVEIRTADSSTLSTEDLLAWSGSPYRLFSVDGGHTAAITASDLRIASAALAQDGLLILDDYFNAGWPGVSEGTCRFLSGSPPVEAVGSGFNKMFLAPAAAAPWYREELRRVAGEHEWKVTEREFFGTPHLVVRSRRLAERAELRGRELGNRVPVVHTVARRVRRRLRRFGPR